MRTSRLRAGLFWMLLLPMCFGQTCSVEAVPDDLDDGNTGTSPIPEPDPPPTTITIRLINASSQYAVDVELYTSSTPVSNIATDLFIDSKKVTESIGFAGTGLIAPGQVDSIQVECGQAVVIGTKGGRFVNIETGAEIRPGQQRVAQMGMLYQCGDIITLRYRPDGEAFTTDLFVE